MKKRKENHNTFSSDTISIKVLFCLFLTSMLSLDSPTAKGQLLSDQLKNEFKNAALRAADWIETNQIKTNHDANQGRIMLTYDSETETADYRQAGSWMQGVSIMGLLMAYHRTDDAKYFQAAARTAEYVKTLQILDARNFTSFGAFREYTPQTEWIYPRDALTASWSMLWMYEETKDPDYFYRAKIFNRWFVDHVMKNGWPAWKWSVVDNEHDFLQGSFHGGSAGYFYDYARVTDDRSDMSKGLRDIADEYMSKFLQPDGNVKVIYDAEKGRYIEDGKLQAGMQIMHRHNDDFGSIALLQAYVATGDEKYLKSAEAYAEWLISEQRPDGGYGDPDVPPAAATGPILLVDLYKITGKEKYLKSAINGGRYLLTQQNEDKLEPRTYGGVWGYGLKKWWGTGEYGMLNLRTSSYAIIAWLKLEGVEQGPYFSPFDRKGSLPESLQMIK